MFKINKAFSSFSVDDLQKAKVFYHDVLGVTVNETAMGLDLRAGAQAVFVYAKNDHVPATFTVLNFHVDNIDQAVADLVELGVRFEHYDGDGLKTDARGIMSDHGMKIAWFRDPAGNYLSVIEVAS